MQAAAVAHSNIALVKYWGKRDTALNLPSRGSISLTLDGLQTRTEVRFEATRSADEVQLDGREDPATTKRVTAFLDLVRAESGRTEHARVTTTNDFPTGAGLASSASGFAALAVAVNAALELGLSAGELSVLARRGSGSAARSIFGGWAEMAAGESADGTDAHARAIADVDHLPVAMLVAVIDTQRKATGSTEGMTRSAATSPYHGAWLDQVDTDLQAMRSAIADRHLSRIGAIAERSCLAMHASMLASEPPLLYWQGTTVDLVRAVPTWRAEGLPCWFTIDAGPQVKVLTSDEHAGAVKARLHAMPGVRDVLVARPGPGAHVVALESGA